MSQAGQAAAGQKRRVEPDDTLSSSQVKIQRMAEDKASERPKGAPSEVPKLTGDSYKPKYGLVSERRPTREEREMFEYDRELQRSIQQDTAHFMEATKSRNQKSASKSKIAAADLDIFNDMAIFDGPRKAAKAKPAVLDPKIYLKEYFPEELRSIIDPQHKPKSASNKTKLKETAKTGRLGTVGGDLDEVEGRNVKVGEDGESIADDDDDEFPSEQEQDTDFEEDEDDADDYNAETYFENGEEDGDDGGGGGEFDD